MSESNEIQEIVKSIARKNTAHIVKYFKKNLETEDETAAAFAAFDRAKREMADIGHAIALTRQTLREEFEEGKGLITEDDEIMLRTVESLYQYILLYEKRR